MNRIIFVFIVFSLAVFFGCNGKEQEVKEPVVVKETVPEKETEPAKETQPELTSDNFDKGASVSQIGMSSIKTGERIILGNYKGKKMLLDFWSSWCEPCVEMLPVINKLKKELEDKEKIVKIISISVDPSPGKARKVMEEKGVEFEVLQAPESLGNSGILLPYLAIADESGKIIFTSNGKHTYEELVKMIKGK